MKPETKRILYAVATVLVLSAGTVVWGFFKGLRTFVVEDKIHGTFFPVSVAIDRFAETNGVPPKTLDQLVPSFLVSIPTSPLVDKLDYRVVGESNWIMNVHSRELKPWRTYSWRSNWTFSDEEKSRMLKQFHDITVLKD